MEIEKKVDILIEALPYIKKYQNKTFVVKFGGNAMINDEVKNSVIEDLVFMQALGINIVISHGGGPVINDLLKRLNVESEFVNGLRVTDSSVMEAAELALAGKVNADLVKRVKNKGGNAVGLSGVSGGIYNCQKLKKDYDYGFVGDVISADATALNALIFSGFIPIVAPIGSDYENNSYNINGDIAAASLATSLKADKLILLTDIEGLCNDIVKKDVISYLNISDIDKLKEKGVIAGGMIPKIDCCREAIENGVTNVHIMDGRKKHSLLYECFMDDDFGTVVGKKYDSKGIKW